MLLNHQMLITLFSQNLTILSNFDQRESWPFCASYSQFSTSLPRFFSQKCHNSDYCFGQRLVIFDGFKIVNIFWKMPDFNNVAPTIHSLNNELFPEFLVKLTGFLLTKKLFSLLKCFNFFREPEPPSDSGILRPRRGSSFTPFFDKKISKTHTFCWFCW